MRGRVVQGAGALLVLGASAWAVWDASGPGRGLYPDGFVYEAAVPVGIAVLPQVVRRRVAYIVVSWLAAALIGALLLLAAFSVGIFYVPGAATLVVGAALASTQSAAGADEHQREADPGGDRPAP